MLVFAKPMQKKAVSNCLPIITCFTLIKKDLRVRCKKFFNNTKNSLTELFITW